MVEVDRKLVLGIEWDSIQEAQEQTGIPDLETKIADGQYIVWPEEKSYIMTVDTFRALCSWDENDDVEATYGCCEVKNEAAEISCILSDKIEEYKGEEYE